MLGNLETGSRQSPAPSLILSTIVVTLKTLLDPLVIFANIVNKK